MNQRASNLARHRFHRYVAVLLAVTVPIAAAVELTRALDNGMGTMSRLIGPVVITTWAIVVASAGSPNALALVLGTMGYVSALVGMEALFAVEITSLDFATAFGMVLLFAVLAGNLTAGRRLVWAGGLAAGTATWVIVVGMLVDDPLDAIGMRAVVAVAGVVFTTALVSELYDQLLAAIIAHERSVRLHDAIARCSEALLAHPDSFALYEAVRAILEATDADYAYVDETRIIEGEPGWEIVASASKVIDETGGGWQRGRYSAIPSAYERLSAGLEHEVHTKHLTGIERDAYAKDDILSEFSVPIFVGKEFRGSVGFVQYSFEREWSRDEVQTLWRAADMIGAYWRRQEDAVTLRNMNESKDKLLASVSHEIRTPLTAIVGLSEEIAANRSNLGGEELEELNSIIAVQSRELAELVEDLLIASRADFGNLSIRPEEVDLGEQVERVLQGVRESNPTAKHINFEGESVSAWADPLRVRQIIRNLVTNAIKYGGHRIVISVWGTDDTAQIAVADDGAGVPEAEANLIFERYYRGADSPTQPGSVGIGLAVSRQLAEMMQGSLAYVPGSHHHRFELSLPLSPPALEEPAPATSEFATS